ncbi:MAG: dynamin family protein [Burkholderiaceae bacterium]|nr:dynamin family protein [Burkholderiaceae bacterium]
MGAIGEQIAAYGGWRGELADAIRRYGFWLDDVELADDVARARIETILARLADERITVAFVAEFSRGKSELINAIFFSDHGQRIVPSSAGRTTMCPTELRYDPERPASIRLLPVETRIDDTPLADLREQADAWTEILLPQGDPGRLREAFTAVQDVDRVSVDRARQLGFAGEDDDDFLQPDDEGMVQVPRWRHAIVNYPHPLLEMGLVIIDTPGLNAIGAEPELTLSTIPRADAVLFVLAADTGVTRSDIEVWRRHVSPVQRSGRIAVLNKIDGLWDELRDDASIEAEIDRQVASVAASLELPAGLVFPVSAQKGLVARVQGDRELLARSRLPALERALSVELVPRQREILIEHVRREFDEMSRVAAGILAARRRNLVEQLFELNALRGKNRDVMSHMAARIRAEREDFEKGLRHLQGLRSVFSRHSQTIFATIGADALRRHVRAAREEMRTSNFSSGLRTGMDSLIGAARADFGEAGRLAGEVGTLMSAMYKSFSAQHGLSLGSPILFSMKRYLAELDRIEALQRRHFGAISLVTTEKWALMRRFFESVASRLKALYEKLNRDIQAWLRAVMAPIEGQIREHQDQLKRRLDSVRRVIDANGSLDERIGALERMRAEVEQRTAVADELVGQIGATLGHAEHPDRPVGQLETTTSS